MIVVMFSSYRRRLENNSSLLGLGNKQKYERMPNIFDADTNSCRPLEECFLNVNHGFVL